MWWLYSLFIYRNLELSFNAKGWKKPCEEALLLSIVFSDPPLEEDDIPDGEWLCNECKALPKEVVIVYERLTILL